MNTETDFHRERIMNMWKIEIKCWSCGKLVGYAQDQPNITVCCIKCLMEALE